MVFVASLTLSLARNPKAAGWLYTVSIKGINCFHKFLLSVNMSPKCNKSLLWYKIELFRSGRLLLCMSKHKCFPTNITAR